MGTGLKNILLEVIKERKEVTLQSLKDLVSCQELTEPLIYFQDLVSQQKLQLRYGKAFEAHA